MGYTYGKIRTSGSVAITRKRVWVLHSNSVIHKITMFIAVSIGLGWVVLKVTWVSLIRGSVNNKAVLC